MAPLQRFEKLDPQKQARILDEAAREFAGRGYNGASLNRIIVAAGISKGAMYYYFEDKADLFVSVCRTFDARAKGDLDLEHLTADSYWPTFNALIRRAMHVAIEFPEYVGLGKAFYDIPQDQWFEGTIGVYVSEHLGNFTAQIERGQALGVVRDDLPADMLVQLWMAVNTIMDKWALDRWESTPESEREHLMALQFGLMKRMFLPNLVEEIA